VDHSPAPCGGVHRTENPAAAHPAVWRAGRLNFHYFENGARIGVSTAFDAPAFGLHGAKQGFLGTLDLKALGADFAEASVALIVCHCAGLRCGVDHAGDLFGNLVAHQPREKRSAAITDQGKVRTPVGKGDGHLTDTECGSEVDWRACAGCGIDRRAAALRDGVEFGQKSSLQFRDGRGRVLGCGPCFIQRGKLGAELVNFRKRIAGFRRGGCVVLQAANAEGAGTIKPGGDAFQICEGRLPLCGPLASVERKVWSAP